MSGQDNTAEIEAEGRRRIEIIIDLIQRAMNLDLPGGPPAGETVGRLSAIFSEAGALIPDESNQVGASGYLQALNGNGRLVTLHYFVGVAMEIAEVELPGAGGPVQ
jgi:hypothetical protein